jgi:hypothetical protein
LLSETLIQQFCAQWSLLFEHDGPTCLRLRPIASPSHPLRQIALKDIGPAAIRAEITEVQRLLTGPNPFIPHRLDDFEKRVERSPSITAFLVATRLVTRNLHHSYLSISATKVSRFLSNNGADWLFDSSKISVARHFSKNRAKFDPQPLNEKVYKCIFATNTVVYLNIQRAQLIGVKKYGANKIPEIAADRLIELENNNNDLKDWLNCRNFIEIESKSISAGSAIDTSISKINQLRSEKSLGTICSIEPFRDFRPRCIVIDDTEPLILDWKGNRRSFKGLPNDTSFEIGKSAVQRGDDLGQLISILSEAQHLFGEASDEKVFAVLIQAQDLLFRDYYRALWKLKKEKIPNGLSSRYFIDLSARWISMNVPREIMESVLCEEWAAATKVVRAHRGKAAKPLFDAICHDLPSDQPFDNGETRFSRERIVSRVNRIQNYTNDRSAWSKAFQRNYIRTGLDLEHVRFARNSLVHDGKFFGASYYITLLMELLRGVIGLRIACEDAAQKLAGNRTVIDELADAVGQPRHVAAFAIAMYGLVVDSLWTTGVRPDPFWLSASRLGRLHGRGWGDWAGGDLGQGLCIPRDTLRKMREFDVEPWPSVDRCVLRATEIL